MKRAANPPCHNRTEKPHKYPLPALPPNPHARQTLRPRLPQKLYKNSLLPCGGGLGWRFFSMT